MARSQINDPLEKFRFLIDIALPSSINVTTTAASTNGGSPTVTTVTTNFVRLGFHDVQIPKRTTTKIHYREGWEADISSLSAGLSTMEDIVMSRGLLAAGSDPTTDNAFLAWISAVHTPTSGTNSYSTGGPGQTSSNKNNQQTGDYRGEITVTMLDRAGQPARSWTLHQAWPVHYVPGSDLNAAEDGDKSIESLTLAYEDFTENNLSA